MSIDTLPSGAAALDPRAFEALVQAELDGRASEDELALLEADRRRWEWVVEDLLDEVEDGLDAVRESVKGPERMQVLADFEAERHDLVLALRRARGLPEDADDGLEDDGPSAAGGAPAVEADDGVARLQLSWSAGRLVAWAAGPTAAPLDRSGLAAFLDEVGAGAPPWAPHASVQIPGGPNASGLAVPAGDILGWLAAVADRNDDDRVGASVRWFSAVAAWAVELVAKGSMVPLLKQKRKRRGSGDKSRLVHVRWTPALVDANRLNAFAKAMPGSVRAVATSSEARDVTNLVLTAMVDAICRQAAQMVVVAAPPPTVNRPSEVAEAFLTRLDGSEFTAPSVVAGDVAGQIDRWAKPVVNPSTRQIVVQLDPPDVGGAWHLKVLAPGPDKRLVSVDVALVNAGSKRRELEADLGRLERLLPELNRLGSHRRGDVILSQDEAWQLMSVTGRNLITAGFDVRVPAMSPRKVSPALRLDSDPSTGGSGAGQLAKVRWSVVFDDVELTAAEIAKLAKEARPLVRSGGKWVAVEHADLEAAAAALEERASTEQLTGAEMLRYALGLEGTPLAGGVQVQGASWATDILRTAQEMRTEPADPPDSFVGELRSYQRDALAWLNFLDAAGLGGCLALDMGLGKTPTMLSHLLATHDQGPALVVAPPAVVTNWASEANKFTPELRVLVHHGARRASAADLAEEVEQADVIITTYGTAVRDVEALSSIEWTKMVLDEAQVIKNPTSETAQLLRRIGARTKVALTGTPIENGLGDLWAILDFTNPGLVGARSAFVTHLSADRDATRKEGEDAMRALNGILVFRRTKDEPVIAAELPDRIDEIDHCAMTPEQIGLYQAVIDRLLLKAEGEDSAKGHVFAAITALKQITNHPAAYTGDDDGLPDRSGKLARLDEIVDSVFSAGERIVVFTQYAEWGQRMAEHLTKRTKTPVECYHGGLTRTARDQILENFNDTDGAAALVLSLKAGGTGLNLTAANHVVLYDRWWNPAVEDQARDRAWRLGQTRTVIYHQLICPGTIDSRVEEVVAGKRKIADVALPKSSSVEDLDPEQLRRALGLRMDELLDEVDGDGDTGTDADGEEDAA